MIATRHLLNRFLKSRATVSFCVGCLVAMYFLCGCCLGINQQLTLTLTDGMVLGPAVECNNVSNVVAGIGMVNNAQVKAPIILFVDDGLRRTYVNTNRAGAPAQLNQAALKIILENKPANNAPPMPPGPIVGASPFEKFGRRLCFIQQPDKLTKIVQGITEFNTNFVRVEGLNGKEGACEWDMRLAPSSFNSQMLSDILLQNASQTDANDWVAIVNLLKSWKRYEEARAILKRAILKFPELESLKPELMRLDQNVADQLFVAADTAVEAGQTQFSRQILESIKRAKLSVETQFKVLGKLDALSNDQKDRDELLAWIAEDLSKVSDVAVKNEMLSVLPEIGSNLTADTSLRFTDYRRRRSDTELKSDQLAALAFSGWIFGPTAGKDNAPVVASGIKARRLIAEYLSKPEADPQILQELIKLESGTPAMVASILAHMPPPYQTPDSLEVTYPVGSIDSSQPAGQVRVPGRFAIEVPMRGELHGRTAKYVVQLPPEYNPFRRYPCIFSLPSESTNAHWQVDWWAGQYSQERKRCLGEASKRGYIVVSPDWAELKQPTYNYTENEHAMILAPLRDAMRRFSIDTDRVYISGHFMGADAAWDVALAHPDLWAGAIIISGEMQKYVVQYWNNAIYVPSYFVSGEYDKFTETNGREWDKLLSRKQIDSLITLYRGRKADHFQEELPRIMDWLNLSDRVRNVNFPVRGVGNGNPSQQFEVSTSRAGDRFFWWFEAKELFKDKLVNPLLYKPGIEYKIESSINKDANIVSMKTVPASSFTIWLSPELVNFEDRITISIKGNQTKRDPKPETRVILEDVRGRADRQHPFWMRVDFPN